MQKQQVHRLDAIKVAKELTSALEQYCDRISVCGSLRRRKLIVSDIELVFIPKWADEKVDMFESQKVSLADRQIERWLAEGILIKRPSKIGTFTWGAQNKLAIHAPSRIAVDFFATDEPRWWMTKVIRTGGKNTNLALTTGAQALGRKLHAYGSGFTDKDGSMLVCESEEDVFKYAGVPYRVPWERD